MDGSRESAVAREASVLNSEEPPEVDARTRWSVVRCRLSVRRRDK